MQYSWLLSISLSFIICNPVFAAGPQCCQTTQQSLDLPNWIALLIGLTVTILLGSLIYKKQTEQSRLINETFDKRRNGANYQMRETLTDIDLDLDAIKDISTNKTSSRSSLDELYCAKLKRLQNKKDKILNICTFSHDVLEPKQVGRFEKISEIMLRFLALANDHQTNGSNEYWEQHRVLKAAINDVLPHIPNVTNNDF